MVDGWFFIFFAVILVSLSTLPVMGRVRRNYLFGIRVEPLMRSERAWRDGHRGAGRILLPAAAVLVAYGTCMITEWPSWISVIDLDVLRVVGVVVLLVGLGWGTLRGVPAATQKEPGCSARRPPG